MFNEKSISRSLIIVGLLVWLSVFIIPQNILDHYDGMWGLYVTVFILPILGLLCMIYSLYWKKLSLLLVGLFFLFSFWITFGLSYFIYGP